MGTISYLRDPGDRKPQSSPVTVTAYGFVTGPTFVPWQSVSAIHGRGGANACLKFIVGTQCIRVEQAQAGFDALEAAMRSVFPVTAAWRDNEPAPEDACDFAVLFQRG